MYCPEHKHWNMVVVSSPYYASTFFTQSCQGLHQPFSLLSLPKVPTRQHIEVMLTDCNAVTLALKRCCEKGYRQFCQAHDLILDTKSRQGQIDDLELVRT